MSKELSIKKLETIAVDALEDIKGRDIIVVNTTKLSQMFERIVLATPGAKAVREAEEVGLVDFAK